MANFDAIRFQPSRPLLKELSAERLNTILQEIRRNRPKGERGITVRQTGDGTIIGLAAAIKAGASLGGASANPYEVFTRTSENGSTTFVGINPESFVYFGLGSFVIRPDNLLVDPSDENDTGWFSAVNNNHFWLEWDKDLNEGDGGMVIKYGGSGEFDPLDSTDLIEFDDDENFPKLKKARKVIAKTEIEDDSVIVRQYMNRHQSFQDVIRRGFPVAFWFDWTGVPPAD